MTNALTHTPEQDVQELDPYRRHRRRILSLATAGVLLSPMISSWAFAASASWPRGLRSPLIINGLGGLDNPNDPEGKRTPDGRALSDSRAAGLDAVNVTIARPTDSFEQAVRALATWEVAIRERPDELAKVLRARDILEAKSRGKIGVIYGFQNTALIEDKLERLDLFIDLGLRIIQLTYNPQNQVGGGSMTPGDPGLTPFGYQVVERLNARQVLVDLAHSGRQTCLDAIRASRSPVTISHAGCRALSDLPRNKTDEELRALAEKGGVIGIYFMAYLKADMHPSAEDVVRHIEHAIDICGEDHVGIGTDGPVTQIDDLEAYEARLAAEVERRKQAGIGAAGEAAGTYPFIVDLRGVNQFRELARRLHVRGHRTGRIEKVLGRNFLRLMSDVWGG